MQENLLLIKKLFNTGKLKIKDLEFYANKCYEIQVKNGKVTEILSLDTVNERELKLIEQDKTA